MFNEEAQNFKMNTKRDLEKFNYIMAINDFLGVYADQNFGYMPPLNLEMISEFINSNKFIVYSFDTDLTNKDNIFKMLENEILDGFPIWRFFILSEWCMNMHEVDLAKQIEEAKAKIICYKCSNYECHESSFGVAEKCLYEEGMRRTGRSEPLEVKTTCENFNKELPKKGRMRFR